MSIILIAKQIYDKVSVFIHCTLMWVNTMRELDELMN